MSCNCITRVEGTLEDKFREKAGNRVSVRCTISGIRIVNRSLFPSLLIPFRVNGEKKGFTSAKGKEISVNANYCPFCGKSMQPFDFDAAHAWWKTQKEEA